MTDPQTATPPDAPSNDAEASRWSESREPKEVWVPLRPAPGSQGASVFGAGFFRRFGGAGCFLSTFTLVGALVLWAATSGAPVPYGAPTWESDPAALGFPSVAARAVPLIPAIVAIEAETLLATAQVSAQAAAPIRQDMAGFGPGWGGNAQLFWRPPAPVDTPTRDWPHITLYPQVAEAGRYAVTPVYTQAPDFGNARVFVRGQPRGDTVGYAATVRTARIELGEVALNAGNLQLVLTVFGKAQEATGFAIGLDRIELRRR